MIKIDKLNINLFEDIRQIINDSKLKIYTTINTTIINAYWNIGKKIVEEKQEGKKRAGYGEYLIKELSIKLTKEFGKGFSERNLWNMIQLYKIYPIMQALPAELTWTHFIILFQIEDKQARKFYEIECSKERWSTRELDRQINAMLYERLSLSRNKNKVLELSKRGQIIDDPKDIIKEYYVLEFLGLKEDNRYLEKDLEKRIINNIKYFLMELGKGYAFIGRQRRIKIGSESYYIDLVFYNTILKCFVIVDLKTNKLTPQDIGQMDFYVRYFEKEVRTTSDNPTIGLILCAEKDKTMIKYTLLPGSEQLFASKYKLYLPTEEELRKEIENTKHQLLMDGYEIIYENKRF
ncbi:MAG: PDDEXK nuclease domain-containing protein [archaeon]